MPASCGAMNSAAADDYDYDAIGDYDDAAAALRRKRTVLCHLDPRRSAAAATCCSTGQNYCDAIPAAQDVAGVEAASEVDAALLARHVNALESDGVTVSFREIGGT